jgi:hypothetical protein
MRVHASNRRRFHAGALAFVRLWNLSAAGGEEHGA